MELEGRHFEEFHQRPLSDASDAEVFRQIGEWLVRWTKDVWESPTRSSFVGVYTRDEMTALAKRVELTYEDTLLSCIRIMSYKWTIDSYSWEFGDAFANDLQDDWTEDRVQEELIGDLGSAFIWAFYLPFDRAEYATKDDGDVDLSAKYTDPEIRKLAKALGVPKGIPPNQNGGTET